MQYAVESMKSGPRKGLARGEDSTNRARITRNFPGLFRRLASDDNCRLRISTSNIRTEEREAPGGRVSANRQLSRKRDDPSIWIGSPDPGAFLWCQEFDLSLRLPSYRHLSLISIDSLIRAQDAK